VQDTWDDDALHRGLLARDVRALEALIARYAREAAYFVRVVLDGVGSAQDAEECVDDLFVTAWEEISSFDANRAALRTWLMMRAKYLALDRRRQIQRRQLPGAQAPTAGRRDGREMSRYAGSRLAEAEATYDGPEGMLEQRERHEQLHRLLEELPELDRLLIYLRYFRLASAEEIAARTGLTRRAIDTRLWRARRTLREAFEALEERTHGHVRAV
jgi:RNA polymerase sigma factor (sigma-70 family)